MSNYHYGIYHPLRNEWYPVGRVYPRLAKPGPMFTDLTPLLSTLCHKLQQADPDYQPGREARTWQIRTATKAERDNAREAKP